MNLRLPGSGPGSLPGCAIPREIITRCPDSNRMSGYSCATKLTRRSQVSRACRGRRATTSDPSWLLQDRRWFSPSRSERQAPLIRTPALKIGGTGRIRTDNPLVASETLSHLELRPHDRRNEQWSRRAGPNASFLCPTSRARRTTTRRRSSIVVRLGPLDRAPPLPS